MIIAMKNAAKKRLNRIETFLFVIITYYLFYIWNTLISLIGNPMKEPSEFFKRGNNWSKLNSN